MMVDARELNDKTRIACDICIVGAGPAALALASELSGTNLRVVLLESGGPEKPAGETADAVSPPSRIGNSKVKIARQLGGSAHAWHIRTSRSRSGVRLLPLAAADLEARPWIPGSGWPLSHNDLMGYCIRAQLAFGLPPLGYSVQDWEEPWARQLPLSSHRVQTSIFQFGDAQAFLGEGLRRLSISDHTIIYHHVTALELLTSTDASHVTGVRAASSAGKSLTVEAGYVVLAGGGLSSAGLLLASDAVQSGGLGNRHDNVGRYLMDHPLLFGGDFIPSSRRLFAAMSLYDLRSVRGTPIMGHLQLTDRALREENLLNLSMMLFPREAGYREHVRLTPRQRRGFEAGLHLRRSWQRKALPGSRTVLDAVMGLDGLAKRGVDSLARPKSNITRGGWSARPDHASRFGVCEVVHQAEQAPHADNRVRLALERNALGMRKMTVDWRWHEGDIAATMRAQDVFASELEQAGLGRFDIAREEGRPVEITSSTCHYMGTTRMSDDPRQGVVNGDCRVHGIDNLYVASSSVFPTGGFANPTLTIVALAIRIADTVRSRLGLALAPAPGGMSDLAADADAAEIRGR
ncbi:GMC oxidoreductase [Microvirga pudoricolor]|uniref:GMC oxidoreductase n=1 Tax=Microvirga pudoricolor TaxID=2778729 RepID=UPI0019514DDF|nr:GMC oxidoreductase [Microvirga pudoricolor]MBM6596354.1 FAD-binding protein [Microvirga pudoricolor]